MAEGSSEDDPDWFERAVGETTDGEDRTESNPEAEPDTGETAESTAETDDEGRTGDTSAESSVGSQEAGSSEGDQETESSEGGRETESSEGGHVAGADEGRQEPESGSESEGDQSAGSESDVPGVGGAEAGVGGTEGSVAEPPGGSGDAFGFEVEEPGEGFETEEYHTNVPRVDVGIEGLDEMIQGGVPERSLLVAIGGAGTGKTTFGLQFLNEALEDGDRGVFITLEESHERILQTAREKGWPFDEYEEAGDLAIVDLDPVDMANSLTSIRNELPRLVEDFGAGRLVLDSVSLLEMMYDDQATRRTEIYDFARSLKAAGVTTLLTSEADEDNPFASRYGVIEYLTDGVFVLRHVRPEDFRETRLAIEIQKIRDANHSRETKPYEITNTGISVYRQANIF